MTRHPRFPSLPPDQPDQLLSAVPAVVSKVLRRSPDDFVGIAAAVVSASMLAAGLGLTFFGTKKGRRIGLGLAAFGAGTLIGNGLTVCGFNLSHRSQDWSSERPSSDLESNSVDESGWESFPASDPPAHGSTKATRPNGNGNGRH